MQSRGQRDTSKAYGSPIFFLEENNSVKRGHPQMIALKKTPFQDIHPL